MTEHSISDKETRTLKPPGTIRDEMRIGLLQNNDANFRTVALWLANDPLYGQVPLARLRYLHQWLSSGRLVVATVEGRLVGAVSWTTLDTETAQRAISNRVLPTGSELSASGDALLVAMIAGSRPGAVRTLMRHFIRLQRGKIVLYERHQSRGGATAKFGWVDRSGVLEGADIASSPRASASECQDA